MLGAFKLEVTLWFTRHHEGTAFPSFSEHLVLKQQNVHLNMSTKW